jgi:MFS family permease
MARFLDRASPPHVLTLVVATSVSALATNVFLPSLPGIARYFDTDYALAQLTVSVYLAATAFVQLGIGPASDRFGRRPVMLVCLGVFLVGSVVAILAPTIELLLAARVLQSFSAAGMVLARAIVRDTVASDQAASRIGYITMGMALVPMVAPVIGGVLEEIHGWQASFAFCCSSTSARPTAPPRSAWRRSSAPIRGCCASFRSGATRCPWPSPPASSSFSSAPGRWSPRRYWASTPPDTAFISG